METGYELLLPSGLLDWFTIVGVDNQEDIIVLHIDEKPLTHQESLNGRYLSKGFYPPTDIHDFPVRNKRLILGLRRRRWLDRDTGKPFMRDLSLIASGTHLTAEFAAFLKELS